jgi:hypothetical protein
MMTAAEQLAYLERQRARLTRRLDVLMAEQRRGLVSPLIQAEGDATIAALKGLQPVEQQAREAAYAEQRRAQRLA